MSYEEDVIEFRAKMQAAADANGITLEEMTMWVALEMESNAIRNHPDVIAGLKEMGDTRWGDYPCKHYITVTAEDGTVTCWGCKREMPEGSADG